MDKREEPALNTPDLLIRAGLVSSFDMSEAIQVSKRLKTPLAQVLINSNCLDKSTLRLLKDIEPLMLEGLISTQSALECLRRVAAGQITADQALDELYSSPRFGESSQLLAELLRLAHVASRAKLDYALEESRRSGTTLVSTLILHGVLSPGMLPPTLRIQELLRNKKMDIYEAAEQLKQEYGYWQQAEVSRRQAFASEHGEIAKSPSTSSQSPPPAKSHKATASKKRPVVVERDIPVQERDLPATLINLLKHAGLVKDEDVELAYKHIASDANLFGNVLCAAHVIDQSTLRNALECLSLIKRGEVESEAAAKALKVAIARKCSLNTALNDLSGWNIAQAQREWRKGVIVGALGGLSVMLCVSFLFVMGSGKK